MFCIIQQHKRVVHVLCEGFRLIVKHSIRTGKFEDSSVGEVL